MFSAASVSRTAACRCALSLTAFEIAVPHWSPADRRSVIGAWMLCSASPVSFSHSSSRAIAARIVIVEVGPRREHLDGLEPVAHAMRRQMVSAQLMLVEEMR